MIGREPDLTVLIDMDPEVALERALARAGEEERFEAFGGEMQRRMREGFLALAKEFAGRFVVIDGGRAVEEVAADVQRAVNGRC